MLLERHWILLKTTPVAIHDHDTVSNACNQKVSAYGKFVDISMETFIKVFLLL